MSTLKVNKLRDTAGSADAITLDPNGGAVLAGVTTVTSVKVGAAVTISESGIEASGIGITVANINGGQISGRRNSIINGDFQIAQRSSAAVISTHGSNDDTYTTVDRFKYHLSGAAAISSQQVSLTAVTDPAGFNYALKISCTTADTSIAASDYVIFQQPVEGYNWRQFNFGLSNAKQLTLSFFVKSNKTGTYCVGFRNNAHDRRYAAEYSISQSDTWEKKSITLTGDTTGTWLATNGGGCFVSFALQAGSTYQVTADTWAAGDEFATSNQVNFTDSTSNTFFITGVQLEVGSQATAFEHRSAGEELALCKRYYNRFTAEGAYSRFADGQVQSTDQAEFTFQHPVTMRAAPTFGSGGTLKGWTENSLKAISSIAIPDSTVNNCNLVATTSGCTRGYAIDLLADNDTTAYIELISEL